MYKQHITNYATYDLKLGKFDLAYEGQMEWYLNWLDKNDRLPREEKPVGIILCARKDQEGIEYLAMDKTGIHVAQYLTELPSREILDQKLKQAITLARENQAKKIIHDK